MTTLIQQSAAYLKAIQNSKRNPVSSNTVRIYKSNLKKWIVPTLGMLPVKDVDNRQAKLLVEKMVQAGRKPAMIQNVLAVLVQVIGSAIDENGNKLYPREWNWDYIDAPVVRKKDQNAPVVPGEAVQEAIRHASPQRQALYTLLFATGLRMGEALALKSSREPGGSWIDWDARIVYVNSTLLNDGSVQPHPKSEAGIREVDLTQEVCDYLYARLSGQTGFLFQSKTGGPMRKGTEYDKLHEYGIAAGFHGFRRARVTRLDSQSVPRGFVMLWAGHADKTVTDGYIKVQNDIQGRREHVQRAGLGFQLRDNA